MAMPHFFTDFFAACRMAAEYGPAWPLNTDICTADFSVFKICPVFFIFCNNQTTDNLLSLLRDFRSSL